LLLTAGRRQLISLLASRTEQELFSTTPAELAARNRQRRGTAPRQTDTRALMPAAGPVPAPADQRSALFADLFHDLDRRDDTPVPLALFRPKAKS
jgi:hypothetical protein